MILPERLAAQSESFAAAGATVLVRPYRPSELYAALRITDADGTSEAAIAAAEADPTRGGAGRTGRATDSDRGRAGVRPVRPGDDADTVLTTAGNAVIAELDPDIVTCCDYATTSARRVTSWEWLRR